MFFSLPSTGWLIAPCDIVFSSLLRCVFPLRLFAFAISGWIYATYAWTLALPFHISTYCLSSALCLDPQYYGRCTNSRNFFLFSCAYMVLTRATCTRAFTYPIYRPIAWLVENLYLIPCPVLRAEAIMDPCTHTNIFPVSYMSIWDRMWCI